MCSGICTKEYLMKFGKVFKVDNTFSLFLRYISIIYENNTFKELLHKGGIVLQDCDAKVRVKLLTPFLFKRILSSRHLRSPSVLRQERFAWHCWKAHENDSWALAPKPFSLKPDCNLIKNRSGLAESPKIPLSLRVWTEPLCAWGQWQPNPRGPLDWNRDFYWY